MTTPPAEKPAVADRPHRRLSAALADLHRTLLQAEAGAAGLGGNPYALLGAVIHDPRFAFLRPLTQLMVALDEMGAKGANPPVSSLAPQLDAAERLLDGRDAGDGFGERLAHWRGAAPAVAAPEAALRLTMRGLREAIGPATPA